MYVYIAYRNLKQYFSQENGFGGVPVNHDYRFIEDVLGKCTGEHGGIIWNSISW
ncbi:MAG: hypothetical protein K5869_09775 [Saccharofermentans sp.]|nr:hypothetical protein [Saccharofermentans sp.]